MKTTPDFLRGQAVATIVGLMHTQHGGGTWSLVEVATVGRVSVLTFKVGVIYPNDGLDERQIVRITVEEDPSPEPWAPVGGDGGA